MTFGTSDTTARVLNDVRAVAVTWHTPCCNQMSVVHEFVSANVCTTLRLSPSQDLSQVEILQECARLPRNAQDAMRSCTDVEDKGGLGAMQVAAALHADCILVAS